MPLAAPSSSPRGRSLTLLAPDIRTQMMYQMMDQTWIGLIFAVFNDTAKVSCLGDMLLDVRMLLS